EFQGEMIPGAHGEGVQIETRRRTGRFEAGHFLGLGPFSSLAFDANFGHYRHREIEDPEHDAVVGASFDNYFGAANLVARHEGDLGRYPSEGAYGVSFTARELTTGGGFSGSRDASALTLAGYLYEELALEPVRLQAGVRYDWSRITPNDTAPIRTGDGSIPVRPRDFGS